MEVKALQFSNAYIPMEVTEFGIVNEVKTLQPENILSIDNQRLTH